MNRLRLTTAQGDPIEKIYYTAVYLAHVDRIKEYYKAWQQSPEPHYWYKLYCKSVNQETILISAIVNVCNAPFGSYALEKWNEDELELAPWLLSSKFNRNEMMDRIFSDQATEEDLQTYERSLKITGSFLNWLNQRSEKAFDSDEIPKMRIAMIGHKRIPSREGGIEVVVSELTRRMAERDFDVTAYNRREIFKHNAKKPEKSWSKVRLVNVPTLENGNLNAIVYTVFATLHAVFGHYDIYHFHAIGPCSMLWLPHLLGKRTVATIHGLDWQRAKWGWFASHYLRFGERIAARYADEVIVLTESARNYFRDTYKRSTTLIPNGMERRTVVSDSLINAKYGLSRGDYVLFLARIVPEKGLHYLIEAFGKVKTSKRLVITGNLDTNNAYCNRIYEMGSKDPRVLFTGFVHGQELGELFAGCSMYVLPSDVEGMPLSLLEAISHGARCLASDIPENIEASKGVVRTFEHGNVESLRESLQDMLDHPDVAVPANASWASWDEVTDQTLRLYSKAIKAYSARKAKK